MSGRVVILRIPPMTLAIFERKKQTLGVLRT